MQHPQSKDPFCNRKIFRGPSSDDTTGKSTLNLGLIDRPQADQKKCYIHVLEYEFTADAPTECSRIMCDREAKHQMRQSCSEIHGSVD
jgi:hypothetical protein